MDIRISAHAGPRYVIIKQCNVHVQTKTPFWGIKIALKFQKVASSSGIDYKYPSASPIELVGHTSAVGLLEIRA